MSGARVLPSGGALQWKAGTVGSLRVCCWPGEPLPSCLLPARRNFSVEMYFRNESNRAPWPLTLPGCPHRCPLQDFLRLTEPVVPKDWLQECQLAGGPADTGELPSASAAAEAQNGFRFIPRGLQRLTHFQSWCSFPDSPLPTLRRTPRPQAMPFSQLRKATQLGGRTVSSSHHGVFWPSRWHEPPLGARLSTYALGSFLLTSTRTPVLGDCQISPVAEPNRDSFGPPPPPPAATPVPPRFRMGSFKELPRLGCHLLAAPSQMHTGQSSVTCHSTEVTVVENQWPLAPKPVGQFLSQLLLPVSCVTDSVTPPLTTFLVSLVFLPPPPSSLLYWLLLPTHQWMAPGSSAWLFPH